MHNTATKRQPYGALNARFYIAEFLDKCLEIYQSMLQTQSSPRNPVVVPSGADDSRIHSSSHHPGDGVDAMQYFRAIYPLCDRVNYRYYILNSPFGSVIFF